MAGQKCERGKSVGGAKRIGEKREGGREKKGGRRREKLIFLKSKSGDRRSFPSICCTQWHECGMTKLRRKWRRRNTLSVEKESE